MWKLPKNNTWIPQQRSNWAWPDYENEGVNLLLADELYTHDDY